MHAVALPRTMLRDQIKEVLLARILEGEYAPGQRIVELQLATEFGVSQAPVREALRELEALRLIVSEPHRGARVREITTRELAEVYPVRAALEAEYRAMRAAADRDDAHALVAHDVRFHRVIVEGSGNQTLLDLWSSLRVESRTVITMVKDHPVLHEVAEMHAPLIEAFRTQDRARCGRMLRKHIEHFAKWVPREAAADGDSPPGRPRVRRSAA